MKRWPTVRTGCAIALLWLLAGSIGARPYTLDDLLGLEAYGRALPRAGSDQIVLEKLGRYDTAPAYPFGWFSRRLTSHIYLIDASHPTPPVRLFPQSREAGYWSAGFSPDGRRLAIVRLDKDSCRLGIVDMRSRSVRWLPFPLDLPTGHPDPIWLDNHRLLVVAAGNDTLPDILGYSREAIRELPGLWARALDGHQPSATVVGAGRWAGIHERRPPSTLMLVDLLSGEKRRLLSGDINDIALSADRRQAALLLSNGDIEPDPNRMITPVTPSHHHRLLLLSLETAKIRSPCPQCDVKPDLLAWSPDGTNLLIAADQQTRTVFYRIDAGQMARKLDLGTWTAVEPIVAGSEQSPRAGWMGDRPIILAHAAGEETARWIAVDRGPDPIPVGDQRGRLLDANATQALFASDGRLYRRTAMGDFPIAGTVTGIGFAEQDPFRLGARQIVNGQAQALIIEQDKKGPTAFPIHDHEIGPGVSLPGRPASLLAISSVGRWALSMSSDERGTTRLFLSQPDHRSRLIDTVNPRLDAIDLPRALPLTVSENNVTLHHWLFLPAGASASLPMIVVPYPGDTFSANTPPPVNPGAVTPIANVPLLTALGFAVLYPSIPSPRDQPSSLQNLASSITAAVDAAIASGHVDRSRMAVWGHSYGGYAALAAAAYDHRFKAIIVSSAPIDLLAGYGSLDPRGRVSLKSGINLPFTYGWSEAGQGAMKAPAWRAGIMYQNASPYYQLDNLRSPILLIEGDADQMGLDQSERLLTGLYRLRRNAIMVRYWGETHTPVAPGNIRDIYDRVSWFLDQTMPPYTSISGNRVARTAKNIYRDR